MNIIHPEKSAARIPVFLATALLMATPLFASDATRSQNWEQRDSKESTEATAKEFLSLLVLDDNGMRNNGSFTRKSFQPVARLAKEGKATEALDAYNVFFTDKLRYSNSFGISSARLNPYFSVYLHAPLFRPDADRGQVLETADKLLANTMVLTAGTGRGDVNIGEPGAVNWSHPFKPGEAIPAGKEPDRALFTLEGFTPLVHAYLLTGERKYWEKWIAFADDWSRNCDYLDTIHPCMVGDTPHNSAAGSVTFLKLFTAVANMNPAGSPIMPSRVLAQFLQRRMQEMQMFRILYTRSNTHNWTPGAKLMFLSMVFDEFKSAPLFFREALRRNIEDNAVTQNLPDGTENQQDHWYNVGSYWEVLEALTIQEERRALPIWQWPNWEQQLAEDLIWKREIREHSRRRADFLIHLRTPQGALPNAFGGDGIAGAKYPVQEQAVESWDDPQNQAIAKAVKDPDAGIRPSYDSEWYPYGGYNIVRDGWEKNSSSGAMFASGVPGAYGGYRSRSNNNVFTLVGEGQPLLVEENDGHYMYTFSPVTIDGINQYFHAGVYKVGGLAAHKAYQVSAWLEPFPWRWHASEHFNLMEGVYNGPWSKGPQSEVIHGPYGTEDNRQGNLPLEPSMLGPVHERQVFYVRQAKLWIVNDRISNNGEHRYEQVWSIPTGAFPGFNPEHVKLDAASGAVVTDSPDSTDGKVTRKRVNFSMYTFGKAPLEMTETSITRPLRNGRVLEPSGWMRVSTAWKATGDTQLITAIYPRAHGADASLDLQSRKLLTDGKQGVGFEARTPEGRQVQFLSSSLRDDELRLGDVQIKGEALLLCGGAGMALGVSEFAVNGKTIKTPGTDFEFQLQEGGVKFDPIYRPISPVEIGPEQTTFIESMEVTLKSKTAGIQIRYTLDGTEPNLQSPLYKEPVKVSSDVFVKARAYRPEVTKEPVQMSNTHGTVSTWAVFKKSEPSQPTPSLRNSVSGLNCRYWQADWKQLFLRLDDLAPARTGTAQQLWDLSIVPADNPPIGDQPSPRAKYYAVEYSGYLNVPEDGTYTLHAPREFVWPDTQAGYELRVWLGAKRNERNRAVELNQWYPSTRLHALGSWSVNLKKGLQPFRVVFIDWRTDAASKLNAPKVRDYVWTGATPDLRITGGGLQRQTIPAEWLVRSK
jgi:hypothetical protein